MVLRTTDGAIGMVMRMKPATHSSSLIDRLAHLRLRVRLPGLVRAEPGHVSSPQPSLHN